MSWLSVVASIGMAVGPPLVYADQAYSIVKKQDSTGFSRDVCAILLLANVTRCFFWLGNRFELALLVQSILMILAQLALLYICIRFRPRLSPENLGASTRPFAFWQWPNYTQYLEFLAAFILCQAILFLILGRSELFISILGFLALGLESTLPIPQLISAHSMASVCRHSLAGSAVTLSRRYISSCKSPRCNSRSARSFNCQLTALSSFSDWCTGMRRLRRR
ncbi:hypothetical protein C8Q76DRAFT_355563 [Earliella scabrosa]|nr:hypothetical protein C8Q76DRAFT_355563 [Earliella scabrosa]